MEEYRLELKHVSKSFGEVLALENINFQLGRNEIVGRRLVALSAESLAPQAPDNRGHAPARRSPLGMGILTEGETLASARTSSAARCTPSIVRA